MLRIQVFLLGIFCSMCLAENAKNIMVTGYWPPTNQMLTKFSTSSKLNSNGWKGKNWEGRGYNIHAFFPTFPGGTKKNAKGNGLFEVDYQKTSSDFWRIARKIKPVAILSFGRGKGPWEIEFNARNLAAKLWRPDYKEPHKPSSRPESTKPEGFIYTSSLPVEKIAQAVNKANLGVLAWVDYKGHPGAFLCEYMAYHTMWYQNMHSHKSKLERCVAAGFIHVGKDVNLQQAQKAFEITLRETIASLDLTFGK